MPEQYECSISIGDHVLKGAGETLDIARVRLIDAIKNDEILFDNEKHQLIKAVGSKIDRSVCSECGQYRMWCIKHKCYHHEDSFIAECKDMD